MLWLAGIPHPCGRGSSRDKDHHLVEESGVSMPSRIKSTPAG
nr:MAG TPA: hypothetical protein [Caudoviricetes sp.]